MSSLQTALETETVETLKKCYVTYFGVKPKQVRKAWLTEAMAEGLSDEALVKPYFQNLSELEKSLVKESVFNYKGLVERGRFEAKYGDFPEDDERYGMFYYGPGIAKPLSVFFYSVDRYDSSSVKIPDELQAVLKRFIDEPEVDALPVDTLPETLPDGYQVFEREQVAQSEFHSLLMLLQNKQIKVSDKTGVASLATLKKVTKEVHEYYDDESCREAKGMQYIASFGWLRMMGNSKFTKQSKATLVQAKKTSSHFSENIKDIWDQWVSNRKFDEFNRINNIKGQTGKGKRYFTDVVNRREDIIGYLKDCPQGKWINFSDFSKYLFLTGSELEITTESHYLYIYNSDWGEFYNAAWDQLEALYLRCFLVEYAATLGLVDVVMAAPNEEGVYYDDFGDMECLSRYDGLRFFRLTPLGSYVLGLTDSYESKSPERKATSLSIHRQGRIVFDSKPEPWEQQFLSLYAGKSKETDWKLSRKKIMEATQVGGSVEELKTFLIDRESQPFLPEDCEGLLKQAEANREGVKLQSHALIMTCKSKEIVDLIMNDKVLSKWCQCLGKLQIVIPENKEKAFRDSLNELGVGVV
ncbi:hypothetical protein GZ77_19050 [Endozoicomonas montiporae]|uniref:Helicase XPB/Ssl2 N-terminal domain-containing protein n=2 Tax=Endozoicomonas montiporae TaxID=1027273 RepID=A0A081N2C9_9GAMM|nr:hypothetical protein [Endozoicomonas montiporae]AMO58435.1 hypothetical protein EZMO1_4522 [Endozoicomonas montiporae CL-33]KEQ12602.1 hypothetical protein GZ77_19050 [Endozoicomonas montiporae]